MRDPVDGHLLDYTDDDYITRFQVHRLMTSIVLWRFHLGCVDWFWFGFRSNTAFSVGSFFWNITVTRTHSALSVINSKRVACLWHRNLYDDVIIDDITKQTFKMASLGVSCSSVWNFILVSEEKGSAKCSTCDKVVKRDTSNTSNLQRYL